MATVYFADDNIRVKVPAGMSLREAAQKCGASTEFGCRVGDCSTCVAHVIGGNETLSEINEKEARVLEMLGGDVTGLRLLCQCRVCSDGGEITVSQRG